MSKYDYIIIGAGASGLMLASGLVNDPYFRNKRILLLDRDNKLKMTAPGVIGKKVKANLMK